MRIIKLWLHMYLYIAIMTMITDYWPLFASISRDSFVSYFIYYIITSN